MASLTIYIPDQEPIEVALDGYEQISVGRAEGNDLVLDHVSMSSSHAVLRNVDGTFQVEDLGSTNGTFLNGDAVSEGVLANGSRVAFGHVEAVFSDEAAAGGEVDSGAGAGSGYAAGHAAELAEVSNRDANFTNLSPIEKVEKKDMVAMVAMIVGVVAILAAAAVAGLAATMSAS